MKCNLHNVLNGFHCGSPSLMQNYTQLTKGFETKLLLRNASLQPSELRKHIRERGWSQIRLSLSNSIRYPSHETRACSTRKARTLPVDDGEVTAVTDRVSQRKACSGELHTYLRRICGLRQSAAYLAKRVAL